ncbi:MAG TPA: malonic semialdehyde reductase [Tepidisphaeraceae bacterium]|jgi:3-hydroxypropanoate dehydrogenase|nr:malonic semialdehyde reductase [Tepidisphaeraceae bacterium]
MKTVSDEALDVLFREARTHTAWLDKPVPDELLRRIYDLAVLGPTSANSQPMRVVFVKSPPAKDRLRPALSEGNVAKVMAAPATAIIAYDTQFHELFPRTFPHAPQMVTIFAGEEKRAMRETHALRNSSLEGAYLIIAARAFGLDAGPMSGFDNAKVDAEFFPDGRWKSNFLCNLGYGDPSDLRPRNPRLPFDEACKIL